MLDKELIRREVERLINDKTDGKHVAKADVIAPKRSAYLDILNFIDSLPEANEDLEESARHYLLYEHVSPLNDVMHQADLKAEMQYHKDIENAFKVGAEWQKQEMMKDAVNGIVGGHTDIPAFINLEIEHKPNVKVGDEIKILILKENMS